MIIAMNVLLTPYYDFFSFTGYTDYGYALLSFDSSPLAYQHHQDSRYTLSLDVRIPLRVLRLLALDQPYGRLC